MSMKTKAELVRSLYDNGIDFIKQSLEDFDEKKYKYSIIHYSNGVEVLLKAAIAKKEWQKIFTKPLQSIKQAGNKGVKTISIQKCLSLARQEFGILNPKDLVHLKDLASERNSATHFVFKLETKQVLFILYGCFEIVHAFLKEYEKTGNGHRSKSNSLLNQLGDRIRNLQGPEIVGLESQVNERIELTKKLIEQWQLYLKGIQQHVYRRAMDQGQDSSNLVLLASITTVKSFRKGQEIEDNNSFVLLSNSNGYFLISADDYLSNSGKRGIPNVIITPGESLNPEWLKVWIQTNQIRFAVASTIHKFPRISTYAMQKQKLYLPSLRFQNKTGELIRSVERKITFLEAQLDNYTLFHRGITQRRYL